MSTSVQEQSERLAREAAIILGLVLDDAKEIDREAIMEVLGKLADIIVLNGK